MSIGPTFMSVMTGLGIITITALVLSSRAQTASVIQSGGSALAGVINAAVSPVTGGNSSLFGSVGSNSLGSLAGLGTAFSQFGSFAGL